jgi:hypothetical protein
MKSDTLTGCYQVTNSGQPVKLSITIGNGQNAISKLLLNDQVLTGPERDGSFVRSFESILGTNNELTGKKLQMTTLILNNKENIDRTSLILSLTGGITQYAQKLEQKVAEKGGVVKYMVSIKFYR